MPARKSAELHTSHHTKAELEDLKQSESKATASRTCFENPPPEELIDDVAVKEWERIREILKDMEIIGDLDLYALISYCNAYSFYLKATKELSEGEFIIETEKGKTSNPLIKIQDLYARQLRDYAMKAGLSIDARLKHASLKVKKEDNDINDMFGDF